MSGVDVSYLVPAYDAEDTLGGAVASALAQEGVSVEVVVVDDASGDATAARAEELAAADPRVRAIPLERNSGPSVARNAAITAARGRWLGVLDADDALEPGRTRRLLDLAALTRADIVADNLQRLSPDGEPVSTALPTGPAPYAFAVDADAYCRDNVPMAGRFGTGYLKPLFAADLVRGAGLRYDPAVRVGEDFLLCLDALLAGARYVVESEPGYLYRARSGSLSHRIAAARLAELEAGLDRLCARRSEAAAQPPVAEAIAFYRTGLSRARAYLETVETAKRGERLAAAGRIAGRPGLWPLAARYGGEALAARLPRIGRSAQ